MNRLLAAALAAAPLAAQAPTPAPKPDASARLHAAWLREVLDLDVSGAIADYRAIAAEVPGRERWLAMARLTELHRMGLPTGTPPTLPEAPLAVRTAMAGLAQAPLDVDALQKQVANGPVSLDENASSPAAILFRPASTAVQAWLRDEAGPSIGDLQARRMQADLARRAGTPRTDGMRLYDAREVLQQALDGNVRLATTMRRLYFQSYKEPTLRDDAATTWLRVRGNLDAWLKEPNVDENLQRLLTRLREELETRAAADVATAIALVKFVPYFSERLLADRTNPTGTK